MILRAGHEPAKGAGRGLKQHVGHELGPERPEKINFVPQLPKTRSGKIMRRVLRARARACPKAT